MAALSPSSSRVVASRAGAFAWDSWLAGAVLVYACVWCAWSALHGYGFDDDAYSIVRVWQQLVSEHVYLPSRFQGSVAAELPEGLAAHLFGSAGSNLVVTACAAAGLLAFHRTMTLYGIGCRRLAIAATLSNGLVLIACATSMDYMVAFGLFSLGLYALAAEEDVMGVALLGLSAGARIFYVTLAELAVVFVLVERARHGRGGTLAHIAACMAATFLVAGLCYLPVWFNHGLKLDWLGAARPTEQGAVGLAARWAYKLVMFCGLPGLALAGAGWLFVDRGARPEPSGRLPRAGRPAAFGLFAALVVALHLALFAWIPIDGSYLIPALPFGAAAMAALGWRGALAGLTLGQLVSTVVVLDPLTVTHPRGDVCMRSHATGVQLRPHVAPGLLVEDMRHRELAQRCGEQVLLFRPATPTSPLPTQRPGDHGVVYSFTPPIEVAPDWEGAPSAPPSPPPTPAPALRPAR